MKWSDLKNEVGAKLPMLGNLLAGRAGEAVGQLVADVLGVEAKPERVFEALQNNPDALLKLEKFKCNHEYQLQQLALEHMKVQAQDRRHAREQHHGHWMPSALTLILAMLVASIFAVLVTRELSASVSDIVYMIAGQVLTAFLTTVSFWVGTSKSSADKTKIIGGK